MIGRLFARASLKSGLAQPRRSLVILMGACVLIAATAAVCQVWTRMRALEYGYKLSKATTLHVQLLESNRRLRLEVAVLTSPTRIAEVATGELGLRPPTPEQIRRIHWRGERRPAAEVASRVSAPPTAPPASPSPTEGAR